MIGKPPLRSSQPLIAKPVPAERLREPKTLLHESRFLAWNASFAVRRPGIKAQYGYVPSHRIKRSSTSSVANEREEVHF